MKTIKFFAYTFFALSLVLASCSAEDGEDGINGEDGAMGVSGTNGEDGEMGVSGTDGEDGNANVIASDWIDAEFSETATNFTAFDVVDPIFTEEVVSSSAILAYGNFGGLTIVIPYVASVRSFYFAFPSDSTAIRFIGTTTDGSRQLFNFIEQVRYVVIPPAETGGRSSQQSPEAIKAYYESQGLDLNDYDAVMEYFDLEK